MKAYDIVVSDDPSPSGPIEGDGHCFGLPPGIRPEQWPLDPFSGHPMKHGFTIRLPEGHRVHGPEIAGLSFFVGEADYMGGSTFSGHPGIPPVVERASLIDGDDSDLAPFAERARSIHPRTHAMKDILGCSYAAILLTQEELDGEPCPVPHPVDSPLLAASPEPAWSKNGSYVESIRIWGKPFPTGIPKDARKVFVLKVRENDPNAGIPPRDADGKQFAENGYHADSWWDGEVDEENWREPEWLEALAYNHLGGTMRPAQAIPELSAHYIGFEEDFGGYNFGTGNAQLDFENMVLEWAC